MTPEELRILRMIRDRFGAILVEASDRFNHRTEVLAGILMRESHGGELLDANGLGDGGHGHGLMQIDDRSFPAFCKGTTWRDPAKNIEFGATVLHMKRAFLDSHTELQGAARERATIAAYNCGEGNVLKSVQAGEDIDARTSNHDYSRCVLEYAEAYRQICADAEAPAVEPDPVPEPKTASGGLLTTIFQWALKLFGGRKAKDLAV